MYPSPRKIEALTNKNFVFQKKAMLLERVFVGHRLGMNYGDVEIEFPAEKLKSKHEKPLGGGEFESSIKKRRMDWKGYIVVYFILWRNLFLVLLFFFE